MVAVDFGDLKATSGLTKLNNHMSKKSYVAATCPTQEDLTAFSTLASCPSSSEFPHAARWYKHIASFSSADCDRWPGQKTPMTKKVEAADDFDLFGEETAEEATAREAMKASAPKKEVIKKKEVISKSTLVIEIKPQNLSVNLDDVEKAVREIKMEGLEWSSASKKVPVAFGLFKLQLGCIIIDDLVSTDDITGRIECIGLTPEQIERYHKNRDTGEEDEGDEDEDAESPGLVQSAEIVSFQKL